MLGSMELGLDNIADKVVFGRAPTCDVVVEHLSCSRAHAQARSLTAMEPLTALPVDLLKRALQLHSDTTFTILETTADVALSRWHSVGVLGLLSPRR